MEFSFLEPAVISELVSDLSGSVVPCEQATPFCYSHGLSWLHANVGIVCPISVKNPIGISIVLGGVGILITWILPVHEHSRVFPLICVFNFFFSNLHLMTPASLETEQPLIAMGMKCGFTYR